ncbi:MAG: DUF262 domain-containing protein [Acidobacteria bacterium]|nr:DUF262 domain-containing protein [Acidobacteriota bacterium]
MQLPQPRQYTVNDFQEWAQRDALVLQPKFQRRKVWHEKAKSYLLDSMVRGFPVPPIYVREILDANRRKTVREVVDGQQRLQTVLDFLDCKQAILKAHNKDAGGKTFEELAGQARRDFLNYPFTVVVLVGADDATVFRTFERLNSYTLPLNSQEKLNAKYFGAFKQFVFGVGQDHLEFWRQNEILTNRNIVRMGEAELTSELVVAMLDGLQDKKKSLESFYKKHDDEFPRGRRIRREFEACISRIAEVMAGEIKETPYGKRVLFYSLFCVVYDLQFGLPGSPRERQRIPASAHAAVRRALKRLGDVLEAEEPTPAQARFIEACARQTDNIGPRKVRHKHILEAIESAL